MKQAVERVFCAENINRVCNHPAVRPWLGGDSALLDFTPVLTDRRNVLLAIDGGGILFHFQEPTVYEAHTQFLPEVRGSVALRATRDALEWMFTRTDCLEVLSKAPHNNPAADRWARLAGGTLRFSRDDCWAPGIGINFYGLTFEDWKYQNIEKLCAEGHAFHKELEVQGFEADHSVDCAHDCAVGAAALMFKAGQSVKAVVLYNRWARFAGYEEISLLAQDLVDIGTCKLQICAGGTFKCL